MQNAGEGSRAAFQVPPHLLDPSHTVAVWFTEPPGAVIQFTRPAVGTVALAEWLVGPAQAQLVRRFPDDCPLVFVLDLGLMTSRDPVARPILTGAARALKERVTRSVLVAPVEASSIYLASLKASISLLRVFGVTVSILSLPEALESLAPAHA